MPQHAKRQQLIPVMLALNVLGALYVLGWTVLVVGWSLRAPMPDIFNLMLGSMPLPVRAAPLIGLPIVLLQIYLIRKRSCGVALTAFMLTGLNLFTFVHMVNNPYYPSPLPGLVSTSIWIFSFVSSVSLALQGEFGRGKTPFEIWLLGLLRRVF